MTSSTTDTRKLYRYNGGVMIFDRIVCDKYAAETMAASEKKAACNIMHRYKQQYGLLPSTKITLTGRVKEI